MVELPKAIAAYIAASNAHDADACAACFTDDAIVRDEGREVRGFTGGRTNVVQGAVHLVLFLAFLALIFDP
jgi:ketosteroid isomerase-like protein